MGVEGVQQIEGLVQGVNASIIAAYEKSTATLRVTRAVSWEPITGCLILHKEIEFLECEAHVCK